MGLGIPQRIRQPEASKGFRASTLAYLACGALMSTSVRVVLILGPIASGPKDCEAQKQQKYKESLGVCVCMCVHMCIHVLLDMYACMYVCIYVCMSMCVCV